MKKYRVNRTNDLYAIHSIIQCLSEFRGIASKKETVITGSSNPINANLSPCYEIKSP